MTQPDVQATLQARFVDDDTLVRTGRALLEVNGHGWVVVPVPDGWAEQIEAVVGAAETVNTIPVLVDAAEFAATSAAGSASAAASSATAANNSRVSAASSATAASQSATNAANSEQAAGEHKGTAEAAAAAAAASASGAAASAGAAASSKSAAATSAGQADASAGSASDAADRAEAGAISAEADAAQTGLDRTATGGDRVQTGLDRQAAAQSATNAATSATNAATSADEAATHEDTSLDAAAAAIAAAVSVAQFQGHGFPEGKVAAPVGSIYTDLDATNGAIRWIKTSDTGNTGWKVEYGDTGWRALVEWNSDGEIITGEVPAILDGKIGPTPGQEGGIYLRREGSTVHGTIAGATSYSDSNVYFSLPAGFRHAIGQQRTYYRTKYHVSRVEAAYILLSGRSALYLLQLDAGGTVAGPTYTYNASTFSFPAEAEWPSIMPWNPPRNVSHLP